MTKKLMSVTVRGKCHEWSFNFYGDEKDIAEWREDGLEINEILNTIPEWAVDCGLTTPWLIVQELFNFRNPWEKIPMTTDAKKPKAKNAKTKLALMCGDPIGFDTLSEAEQDAIFGKPVADVFRSKQ